MSDYLPDELVADILSRLPVKSLLQFRCVCKKWSKIITSSSFAAEHLTRSTSKESDRVLLRYRSNGVAEKEHFFLTQDEGILPRCNFEELDCPFKSRGGQYCTRIVGVCNGLICLSDNSFGFADIFVLWNPSIRRVVHIPRPNLGLESRTHSRYALGFAFDSISDDYKLVRMLFLKDNRGFNIPLADSTPVVEVYSLRSRSWRFVPNGLKHVIRELSSSALVNGACHWLAYTPDRMCMEVVSFHFGDEVFGHFALPRLLDSGDSFGVLGGCLAMIPYYGLPELEDCFVWVMKEYGNALYWTKLFKIETRFNIEMESIVSLIAFRKNGEVLLARESGELVTYHPTTKESRSCNIWGHITEFHFGTFVESLVLLREANVVDDGA